MGESECRGVRNHLARSRRAGGRRPRAYHAVPRAQNPFGKENAGRVKGKGRKCKGEGGVCVSSEDVMACCLEGWLDSN